MNKINQLERYFDHDADIGIIGRGKTLESAFVDAAISTFALMSDLSLVKAKNKIDITFEEPDIEFALVTWLNQLIAKADSEQSLFVDFNLQRNGSQWHGEAWGDKWQPGLNRGIDVKGATLTMLSVKQIGDHWIAQCVVDV